MIRYDTFRFDYDTKNIIVFSRAVVVLLVRHALLLTFWRLAKVAISKHPPAGGSTRHKSA
ncbi:MAG: hypothetical protein EOM23_07720 [Candidatus Moranbacteria bacterium]|nr:hypothetical protein [Candidatus Moranbacteria bacterium]